MVENPNIDVEVTSANMVGATVRRYGVAIWRQLVPAAVTYPIYEAVTKNFNTLPAYVSKKGGVMSSSILSEDLRRARVTLEIQAGFRSILEGDGFVHDDGKSISGLYLTSKHFIYTHPWHQDVSPTFQDYGACAWVAVNDCGVSAPGLSFVLNNPGKAIEGDVSAFAEQWPVISPAFRAGDAVFFDKFSVHATYRTPEMTSDRVAYKVTATRSKDFF